MLYINVRQTMYPNQIQSQNTNSASMDDTIIQEVSPDGSSGVIRPWDSSYVLFIYKLV